MSEHPDNLLAHAILTTQKLRNAILAMVTVLLLVCAPAVVMVVYTFAVEYLTRSR